MNLLLIAAAVSALTRVTPINPAEAVFAPFWDGGLKEMWLTLGELTDHEREIIADGCLINFNRMK